MLRPILFVALLCLFVIYWRMPDSSDPRRPTKVAKPAPQPKPSTPLPPSRDTARRTVAVGDLHSDLAQTLAVLRLANVVDKDENWSGGRATLVQTGDIVDRGPDTIAIYELFDKLRGQAKKAGGQVVNVYGNHEVMNLGNDLRYVTEEDYESFGGRIQRQQAWNVKTGWLGQMIYNNFNISYVHNGHTAFSHGDMEEEWASLGTDTMNHMAREAIWKSDYRRAAIFQGTGPIWSRIHATEQGGEAATCRRVEAAAKALGVKRLISGHTPQYLTGKILSRCNSQYLIIDVGISSYYGGNLAALEILENDDGTQSLYELYPGGGKRLL